MAEVLFTVGASEGSTECLDIVIADDDQTEGLECFTLSFDNGIFVPVCIEDNDGEALIHYLNLITMHLWSMSFSFST